MDETVLNGLQKLKLTKEEGEEICITSTTQSNLLEECSLSLFGRLLSDHHQNSRALKNTLRTAWKLGSDLRIVDVGNRILQFKFNSRFQMEWVEKSGPWNFEDNFLLLCRWRAGLTSTNIDFTHSSFWVQVWGLPFEFMNEEVGKDIGGTIGKFLEVDKRSWQSDQAKYMRIKVDVQLDKPLRRGGFVSSPESGKHWVYYKYERIPTLCFRCGRISHDVKHCSDTVVGHETETQYGDWMRAGWNSKWGPSRSRTTSSSGRTAIAEGTDGGGLGASANIMGTSEPDSLGETNGSNTKPALGSAQVASTEKNLSSMLVQMADTQVGWDKTESLNLKVMEKAKGTSRDCGRKETSHSSLAPKEGSLDECSTVGHMQEFKGKAHEATSPLRQKLDCTCKGVATPPVQGPTKDNKQKKKPSLKKIAR
ncbi:uncharacterized protein LOC111993660 [Quercus suber]|uniref:uncharacterized protein LOC111993660 n=1 Tax=Quercus suber TaxID=58331 RepID=UPI000CE1E794|nr:uncharacterized protein LOC111993660 [Quercus suber]POE74444.1 uncharacterized protein CFP56_35666 [Quercus suber]